MDDCSACSFEDAGNERCSFGEGEGDLEEMTMVDAKIGVCRLHTESELLDLDLYASTIQLDTTICSPWPQLRAR